MSHSFTKKGNRLYRYYVCQRAQSRGWHECPAPSLPAGEIEQFVVDQIKGLGRDPAVVRDTLAQVRRQADSAAQRLTSERSGLVRQVAAEYAEIGRLGGEGVEADPRLASAQDRIHLAERRMREIDEELTTLRGELPNDAAITAALGEFSGLWEVLAPGEQSRIIKLLIDRVAYDGDASRLSITYRPSSIRSLPGQLTSSQEDAA